MKNVVLIGASGFVGSAILKEALNRGFHVTAVVRNPEKIKIENENLTVKKADVSSLEEVYEVCKGADAVISAFNPGWSNPNIYKETLEVHLTIIDGVKKAGVDRFLMVGGAGSLFIAPGVRTGRYRLGKDDMIVDKVGNSHISVEGYAAAMIDELEKPAHYREPFTIGY